MSKQKNAGRSLKMVPEVRGKLEERGAKKAIS